MSGHGHHDQADHTDHEVHEHDRGLSYDLPVLARRRMIRLLAGASLVPLVGCSADDEPTSSSGTPADGTASVCLVVLLVRRVRDHPGRDGRPVPGRRFERGERAQGERGRPQ